jgi:hypothetical protein
VGDIIIRGALSEGFTVVDAVSGHVIDGSLMDLTTALTVARKHGRGQIWQEIIDERGRPIGELFRLST